MPVEELRVHLTRVCKELASWSYALGQAKKEQNRYFVDGYRNSTGKSTAERRMDAEVNSEQRLSDMHDTQGSVDFYSVLRDLIVQLLKHPI